MHVAPTASLVIPVEIVEKARTILNQVVSQIPSSTQGLERQIFIGDFVEKLPIENRHMLRAFVECLLLRMQLINASDIDFGGFGGHVDRRRKGRRGSNEEAL